MILEKAKLYAETFADQTIKDAVITVPSFFNQAERRAVMLAAEMGGLNVLQLMGDNAAGRSKITSNSTLVTVIISQINQEKVLKCFNGKSFSYRFYIKKCHIFLFII